MKQKLLALLVAGVMVICLGACAKSEESAALENTDADGDTMTTASESENVSEESGENDIRIAYIVKSLIGQFWVDMQEGAEEVAQEHGITVDFQAPEKESDVEVQVQYVENAITSGYDAIILAAADSKALNPSIKKANDANIPVILVNDTIDMEALEADGGHVETYTGIDQYEAAALAGKHCVENLDGGTVAIIEGAAGVLAGQQRLEGFRDQLTDDFEIAASQTANWDRNEAFDVMQNILTSNPDITVVWACSAEMGQGAIQAIEQAGLQEQISVYDFDASDDDMAAIEAGTLVGTVAQFPDQQAKGAIEAALKVLDGEKLEEHTVTPAELITKENINEMQ